MKSVPHFVKGPFRNALKLALEEASTQDEVRQVRGWKLLMLLPRMVLHRGPRGGLVPKSKLVERLELFSQGEWQSLLEASAECDQQAAVSRRRSRHRTRDNDERRAARAEMLVGMGELSSARQALEGAEFGPWRSTNIEHSAKSSATTPALRDPFAPGFGLLPTTDEVQVGPRPIQLNLRTARKGAAGGLSGMTTEHLRPLSEDGRIPSVGRFGSTVGESRSSWRGDAVGARWKVDCIVQTRRGVRGIVAGDVIRRLVARTMSQQLAKAAEVATAPHNMPFNKGRL